MVEWKSSLELWRR